MLDSDRASVQRRATYVALSSVFASLLAAFSLYEHRKNEPNAFKPFDLALLGLATYRLSRLVAYDKVFEAERAPFAETVPDPTGAGDTVVPKGTGAQEAIGELISCPICIGTWISAILVYGLNIWPGPTRTLIKVMGVIGLAEVINAATEALQWNGEAARARAGLDRQEMLERSCREAAANRTLREPGL
jgi:hypothetical protein